jgi:branched-chain amino acid transport system substrate-binding protein
MTKKSTNKNKSKKYLLFGICLVCIIYVMYQTLSYKKDEIIHIAFVGPMSGEGAKAGKIMTQAIQLYFEEINGKGGIREKKLVLDIYDDQNNPNIAKQCALKIAEKNQAISVIGHWYSSCSINAGDVYKIYQTPIISPGSIHPDVTRDNNWFFRTIYNVSTPGEFLAYYIKKVMQNNVAYVIHEDGVYSSLSQVFEKSAREVGIDVKASWDFKVSHARLNRKLQDIVNEFQAKKDSTGVVILSVQPPEGIKLIKLLKDAGIENPIIGPSTFSEESFLKGFQAFPKERHESGYYTDGIYVMTPLIYDTANQEAQRFREKYKKQYWEEPDWSAAFAYDSAKVIVKAIQQGGVLGSPDSLRDDRKKIRDYMANLTHAKNAVEGTTGLNYFNASGDAQKPVTIGVYKRNKIISVMTQLRASRQTHKTSDTDTSGESDSIISFGDTYMHKTQIVYTGMDIRKISDLDLEALTCLIDGYIWFRLNKGALDVGNILFLNAVVPTETDRFAQKIAVKLIKKKNSRHHEYRLYHFKGQFKIDFHRVQHSFGLHSLGVSFRHRNITADKLIYVIDELEMGQSLVNKMSSPDVFSSSYGWGARNTRFFQDIVIEQSLGDTDSNGDGFLYSRFNLDIVIGRDSMTLRRMISYQISKYIMLCSFILIFVILFGKRRKIFKRYQKQTWFLFIVAWSVMLLSGETIILGLLMNTLRPFYLERIILAFDLLWWILPAVFLVKTVERFVWIPLEEQTERTIPTIVRRMVTFLISLLTFFGIIAFVFNQKLTGLLATSGMLAMIIGLAIQINISNIFSGIALSVERPFRIGDWIKVSGTEGRVIDMTWRTTRIQTGSQTVLSIPNSVASDSIVENCYYPDNSYWKKFMVYIDPIHPPEQIEKLLTDAVLSVDDDLNPSVRFAGVSKWSANYSVGFSGEDHSKRLIHERAVWENIWNNLNHVGIEFAIRGRLT